MTDQWNLRILKLAQQLAGWSKDPSTKVGCVIMDDDRNQISGGYNGFPRGIADDGRLIDRPTKYKMIVHAEANAIAAAARNGHPVKGVILFTTAFPCSQCCALIIQAGIKQVVYKWQKDYETRWAEDVGLAKEMLCEVGIEYFGYEADTEL